MHIEWSKLRQWNGSQQNAFEELCCQLAHAEVVGSKAKFIRKGTPDSGIEAYWLFPNGDEWGWQAKFFPDSIGDSQWAQIDKSVQAALKGHPRLVQYTVCLPRDLPDARQSGRKSMKDRWDERVAKWQQWAESLKMDVEYCLWGSHELIERVTHERHAGRLYFWFNREYLSQDWFRQHIATATSNAGGRYTPDANVDLPLMDYFDGLGRTASFIERFDEIRSSIEEQFRRLFNIASGSEEEETAASLRADVDAILAIHADDFRQPSQLPLYSVFKHAHSAIQASYDWIAALDTSDCRSDGPGTPPLLRSIEKKEHALDRLIDALEELAEYLESPICSAADSQVLLLVGEAGAGKTHTFCEVASRRIKEELPTILLLGQHFDSSEPWSKIIQLLGLTCSKPHELLGSLNAAAEAANARAIIMIDALNEGEGRQMWQHHLNGMLNALRRFPRVAIAISVRTAYEGLVIPEEFESKHRVRIEHGGFEGHEYEACEAYFDFFGIADPAVPILNPEFSNPLFLKLFCRGLKEKGLGAIPEGLHGLTETFSFFIDFIDQRLARELGFDPLAGIVWQVLEEIVQDPNYQRSGYLHRSVAREITGRLHPQPDHEKSLLRGLLSEGLLIEAVVPLRSDRQYENVISIAYERVADFLMAQCLLPNDDSELPLDKWFAEDSKLGALVSDTHEMSVNVGILEMLSVLVPERTRVELSSLIPGGEEHSIITDVFVSSLIWREPDSITNNTLARISHCLVDERTGSAILTVLLRLAIRVRHPLNADFLHQVLSDQSLASRDAQWSVFLHRSYGSYGPVDAFVHWAWDRSPHTELTSEAARLAAVILSWFFTSSNRFLRDRATKALVSLLQDRLSTYRDLIGKFAEVNDPYVIERVFAAAYGSAARSTNDDAVGELAEFIYSRVFAAGTPPVDIMIREYAAGAVELALHRGCTLAITEERIRPPFNSAAPLEPPSEEDLARQYDSGNHRPYGELWTSLMVGNMGDFAHYILGSIFGSGATWTKWLLGEDRALSPFERSNRFEQQLSGESQHAWQKLTNLWNEAKAIVFKRRVSPGTHPAVDSDVGDLQQGIDEAVALLEETLHPSLLVEFREAALPVLTGRGERCSVPTFEASFACRWVFNRVVQLGWEPQLFEEFERTLAYIGRTEHKAERIGKKYQWIALHELIARLSDNYVFVNSTWRPCATAYKGTWQQSRIRDIDPSMCVRSTEEQQWGQDPCWWAPVCANTRVEESDDVWRRNVDDWPNIRDLIDVRNHNDDSEWLALNTSLHWNDPDAMKRAERGMASRRAWFGAEAYLVRTEHFEEILAWAKDTHFWGRWMPECADFYNIHFAEYPNCRAWTDAWEGPSESSGWTQHCNGNETIPHPILVTTNRYVCEGTTIDCSVDGTVSIHVPSPWLLKNLDLNWRGVEGSFFSRNEELIAVDPSIREPGPGAFVVAKKRFLEFLDERQLSLFWILLGEKLIVTPRDARELSPGLLEISGVGWWGDGAFHHIWKPIFQTPADRQ